LKILSHRGYWKTHEEKNTEIAFRRSFELGFGIETDVRDLNGELVISHDPPIGNEMLFEQFLQIYSEYYKSLTIALNIKADGLQIMLKKLLKKYSVNNYFVFDMAVPDGLVYINQCLKVFTRHSEYEMSPSFYEEAQGIWLDCFNADWIDEEEILKHLNNNKHVCIVSPELHKRGYESVWGKYKNISQSDNLMLCTDFPEDARLFFDKL
jgi:hypothetical protein